MTKEEIENGGMPNVIFRENWVNFINGLTWGDQRLMFWAIINYGMFGVYPDHLDTKMLQYFDNSVQSILDKQRSKWNEYIKKSNERNNNLPR